MRHRLSPNMRQHRWSPRWDSSGSVRGARMKVCEEFGAELIAVLASPHRGKGIERGRISNLVYVPPCEG